MPISKLGLNQWLYFYFRGNYVPYKTVMRNYPIYKFIGIESF